MTQHQINTLKQTALSIGVYLAAYFVTLMATFVIFKDLLYGGIGFGDFFASMIVTFPALFCGNLLPFLLGYGAIKLFHYFFCDRTYTKTAFLLSLMFIMALEFIGTIVYYFNFQQFPSAAIFIIGFCGVTGFRKFFARED